MLERLEHVRSQRDYPELMFRLIAEAHAVLPDAATLVVDPRDLDVTRNAAENMGIPMTVSPTMQSMGGAELAGADGRRVSNTLDARAEKAAAFLRRLAVEQVPELGSA
jgi:vacuolar-type H+-ATPase subunit E/Vma4